VILVRKPCLRTPLDRKPLAIAPCAAIIGARKNCPAMSRSTSVLLLTPIFCLLLSACGLIQKIPAPKLPKIGLPSRNTVAKIIPGMPERDKVNSDDPDVPFNARGTLGYGHTLRIEVFEGVRGSSRIFNDIVMVDEKGLLPLGAVGTARVGGQKLPTAANSIAAVFRVAGRNTRPISVHIISVENVPVLSINGDVLEDEFIPAFDKMTVQQAVNVSGGRKLGSTRRGIYITRQGQRRFFVSMETANHEWRPQAGDIITLSTDI